MAIEEIATFVEAAQRGSMAAASRALGIPTSTVSRRIHRLEDELGVQLVEVHSRLFRVTEAGDALLRRSASAVRDLNEAVHALRHTTTTMRGQLRISAPQDIGSSQTLANLLAGFRQAHPGLELFIDLTNERVDLLANGTDFALRVHTGTLQAQPSLMTRHLGTLHGGLFASPAYLASRPSITTPEDLDSHVLITPTFGGTWSLQHVDTGQQIPLSTNSPVQATSLSFMVPAACAHLGIVPVPMLIAQPAIARGDLVRVLPDYRLPFAQLHLLWPASRLPAPRRRAFLDYMFDNASVWSAIVNDDRANAKQTAD